MCVSSEHELRASAAACWLSQWSAVSLRQLLLLACETGFAQQGDDPLTVLSDSFLYNSHAVCSRRERGPRRLPQRVLRTMRSSVSSSDFQYPALNE